MHMRRIMAALILPVVLTTIVPPQARADEHRHERFREHESRNWQGGYWHQGFHDGRMGWWWVLGGGWYYYPAPIYPYPPVMAVVPPGQLLYYCGSPAGYYPYVQQCQMPWQQVMAPAQVAPPPMAPLPMAPPPPMGPPLSGGPGFDKATGGTVLGAVGGGLAGAQFGHGSGKLATTLFGTLLGAFAGHEVGASLDRADAAAAQQAERSAYQAPIGQTITWNNQENGHSGTITPVRDGRDANGSACRQFDQAITVDGRVEHAAGTACRRADGEWEVVNR